FASNQVLLETLATPPHHCHASIRTLNGPLQGPCKLGFDLNIQVQHYRDEPGIVGAAIYREILIDQHSKRSHPNKAVDVVVCQTSCIDSGSRYINSGPTSTTTRVAIVLSLSASFPWPARLRPRSAPPSRGAAARTLL